MEEYNGIIVEESLLDNRIINEVEIKRLEITDEDSPEERWHIYHVLVSKNKIDAFSKNIKKGWYMHFWKGNEVIAVFKDKIFKFNHEDKSTWGPVLDYGKSQGIPEEQLDFPIY